MQCPDCSYILGAFETECPRCRKVAAPVPPPATDMGGADAEVARRILTPQAALTPDMPIRRPSLKNGLYLCRRCGAANSPQDRACEVCGETIGYDKFSDALRDPGVKRAALESTVALGVVLLCLHVFVDLPDLVQGCVVLSTVAVLGWRFLQALEGRKG